MGPGPLHGVFHQPGPGAGDRLDIPVRRPGLPGRPRDHIGAVIAIEFCVLAAGIYNWKSGRRTAWHGRLSKALFVLWWFSFLSGEIFYLVVYII
ncbi:MAG: hypothetical protein FJ149_13045 [Euryarchaeota archaeon]|nr:hypothetical protein [Euryarchaeota archaeon]